jgi:hypothetical protein
MTDGWFHAYPIDTQTYQIWLAIPKLPKRPINRALEYFSANVCASGQDDKCDEDLALDADASPVPVHA